ncbi:MAG: hypothetical protein M3R02_25340 [Chloroflexota bacterium]|nr:hypothetical protein [Chloroflexota bacterium]
MSDDSDDLRRWWGITGLKQASRWVGEEDRLGRGADFEESDRRRSRSDA